jgi:hypothetical protein
MAPSAAALASNCDNIALVYPNVVTMRGQQRAKDAQGEPRRAQESPEGRRRAAMIGKKGPRYTKLDKYIAERDQDDTKGNPMRGQQEANDGQGEPTRALGVAREAR